MPQKGDHCARRSGDNPFSPYKAYKSLYYNFELGLPVPVPQLSKWSAVSLLHQFVAHVEQRSKNFLAFSVYFLAKMPFSCRFYKHKYPEIDDVVMVNVRSIAEMGAYVNLLEYNNIEGMILLSELSRRRIRSINKLIRVGRNECVVVIRVDKDKGLSLK